MQYIAIIRALVSGWWIITVTAALGATGALLITSTTAPTYRASTSYYVSVAGQDSASAGEIAQGSTAAQQKIKSYVLLASSPRVLQHVVDDLELPVSATALASKITATIGAGTVVITVSAEDEDPRTAARIAECTGKTLASLVSEIEPESTNGTPTVKLEDVAPAAVPSTPVSPRPVADLALGLFGGITIGSALAVLRTVLDVRVRSSADLVDGVPVVGDIAFDPEAAKHPLIARDEIDSPRSEAFRSLRTNLRFLGGGDAHVVAVTSARPAEGKTTTTANLGIALSRAGVRTIIVDADLRRPNIASTMGVEGAAGLTDLLVGRVELEDVLQPWGDDDLTVLPAGTIPPNPSELIGSEAMRRVIAELAARFDLVLVDTPPVLAVTDAALVSTLVTTTLLVTAANQTKRSDVRQAIEALERVGQEPNGIVLTKTKHRPTRASSYRSRYAGAPTAS